jgi:outer membrane immunogenic protein
MRIRKLALLAAALSVPLATPVLAADAILEQPPEPPVAEVHRRPMSGRAVMSAAMASTNGASSALFRPRMPMASAAVSMVATTGSPTTSSMVRRAILATPAPMHRWRSDRRAGLQRLVAGPARLDINPFMIYATGGVAATNAKLTNAAGSDSNTHVGWTAGAGAEAFVTENITTRSSTATPITSRKNYNRRHQRVVRLRRPFGPSRYRHEVLIFRTSQQKSPDAKRSGLF